MSLTPPREQATSSGDSGGAEANHMEVSGGGVVSAAREDAQRQLTLTVSCCALNSLLLISVPSWKARRSRLSCRVRLDTLGCLTFYVACIG